jgi:hypothetical protein
MGNFSRDYQCPYINTKYRADLGLINAAELVAMLPLTKQYNFVKWATAQGILPKPVRKAGLRCLWDKQEVEAWLVGFDFFASDYAKSLKGAGKFESMLEGEHLRLANRFYSVLNELKHE